MVLHVTELLGGYSAEGADQCLLDATIFGTHIKLLDIAGFKSLFKFRRRHLSLASRPIRHRLSHLCRCNQLLDAENLLACHSSEIVRPTAMYSKVGGRVSRPCIWSLHLSQLLRKFLTVPRAKKHLVFWSWVIFAHGFCLLISMCILGELVHQFESHRNKFRWLVWSIRLFLHSISVNCGNLCGRLWEIGWWPCLL